MPSIGIFNEKSKTDGLKQTAVRKFTTLFSLNVYFCSMKQAIPIVYILLLAGFLASCQKESSFSEVPALSFKEYRKTDTSLVITLEFTDGDGDLGLDDGDTIAPFNQGSFAYNNLFLYFQQKVNDSTFSYYLNNGTDTIRFWYRYKNITPAGQKKVLEGELIANLPAPYSIPGIDSFRFEIFMLDRSLNRSKSIYTPIIK